MGYSPQLSAAIPSPQQYAAIGNRVVLHRQLLHNVANVTLDGMGRSLPTGGPARVGVSLTVRRRAQRGTAVPYFAMTFNACASVKTIGVPGDTTTSRTA